MRCLWDSTTAWSLSDAGGRPYRRRDERSQRGEAVGPGGREALGRAASEVAERQFAVIWRTSFDALLVVDDGRRYRRVNPAAERLLGAPREKVLRRRVDDFTPPEHWVMLEDLWRQFQHDGALAGYYEVLRGDRTRRVIEYRAEWDFDAGEHLVVARDLPARADRTGMGQLPGALLTARELDVIQLAANGLSAAETAERLGTATGTIKTHLHRIYSKLGTRDRAAAVAECLRRGLIS